MRGRGGTNPGVRGWFGDLALGEAVSLAALVGGFATTGVILGLSWRAGFDGLRLILVGLSINAIALAGVSYVLITSESTDATIAMRWMTGSLARPGCQTWSDCCRSCWQGPPPVSYCTRVWPGCGWAAT